MFPRNNSLARALSRAGRKPMPASHLKDNGMAVRPNIQPQASVGSAPDGTPAQSASVSPGIVDQIIQRESGGRANAKNPNSSAEGPGQFIDSTWLATVRKHRPDLAGMSNAQLLGMKTDPVLGRQMTEAHTRDNAGILAGRGLEATPRNLYAMHFLGAGAAPRVIGADPSSPIANFVDPAAVRANPTVLGGNRSVGDFLAWAERSMGGKVAPTSSPAASTNPLAQFPSQPPAPAQGAAPKPQGLFAGFDKDKLAENLKEFSEQPLYPQRPRSRRAAPQNTFVSAQAAPWVSTYRG